MKNVSIIGAGAWGSALAHVLKPRLAQVNIIAKKDGVLENIDNISISEYIFIVVPTQSNRSIFKKIQPYTNKAQKIILCSKGFEQDTNKFLHEVAEEYFPQNTIMVLSGPNFASEISKGLPAITTIAAQDMNTAIQASKDLSSEEFVVYPSDDVVSVEIFGALKNVIAIACGISEGFNLGENFKSAVITRLVIEIQQLIMHLGGKVESIILPAGIGDIILTCTSTQSRNTNFGVSLVKKTNEKYLNDNTVEGYYTLKTVYNIAKNNNVSLEIIFYLYNAIYKNNNLTKEDFINIINSK